jgi:hypothetical protein
MVTSPAEVPRLPKEIAIADRASRGDFRLYDFLEVSTPADNNTKPRAAPFVPCIVQQF